MVFSRSVTALALGVVAVLAAGGLGIALFRTFATPVAVVVGALAVGVVGLAVLYGGRRPRRTSTPYW